MKLLVSQAAQADLLRLHDFLADENPDVARRAIAAIVHAIGSLDLFPYRGRPSPIPDARELIVPFGTSGYVIRYVHDTAHEELVILRVWHSRESRE